MDRINLVVGSVLVLSVLIGASPFIFDEVSVEKHEENFNTSISVVDAEGEKMSFGVNADQNLQFGTIVEGTNATKFINMSTAEKSLLTVKTEGNISEFMFYDEKMYFRGDKQIPLEVQGRESGNYTGTVNLEFQIPENKVGRKWLGLKYEIHSLW